MTRWRTYVVLFFLLTPVLVFVGVGGWSMWETDRLWWMWIPLPVGWAIAFLLAKAWGEKLVPLEPPETKPDLHWTPRDKEAWTLVESRMESAADVEAENFTRMQFYVDVAQELANDIAHVYHPKATDPIGSLTIPEIMAAGQLALEDLAELYDHYVPGAHLLTINNFKSLAKLPKRYKLATNILTAATAFINPLAAAGRYAASKTVLSPVSKAIESNLLVWFYSAYLQRVGYYLIEMNSGRLKGGTKKFREAFERFQAKDKPWETPADSDSQPAGERPPESSDEAAHPLTVCVVGQSSAGKSSVIRALFRDESSGDGGKQQSDFSTQTVEFSATGDRLQLLEIAYGSGDDSRARRKERFRAMAKADLVLQICAANHPARDADAFFLDDMAAWFDGQPHLKPPPVVVVLTHIDLLKPPMEWAPPYDWREPTAAKEESIRDAVAHVREEFGQRAREVVPVCSDAQNGRAFGIAEWLQPVVAAALEEAKAVSSVRSLHKDLGSGKVRRVLDQVWNIGKALRGK